MWIYSSISTVLTSFLITTKHLLKLLCTFWLVYFQTGLSLLVTKSIFKYILNDHTFKMHRGSFWTQQRLCLMSVAHFIYRQWGRNHTHVFERTRRFSPLPLSRSILHILIYVTAEWFEPQVKQRICLVVCDSPFNAKENAYVCLIKASPPCLCPTHTTNLTLLLHLYTQEGAQNNTPPFIFHSLKAAQGLVGGCKAVVVTTVTLSELLQGEAEITKSSTQLEATTSRFESSKVPEGAGWSLGVAGQIVSVAKDSTE